MISRQNLFETLQRKLKAKLSDEHRAALRNHLAEPLAYFCRNNLPLLAQVYYTDKFDHWYCEHYQRHLAPLRRKKIVLLEIGILGGSSLRMWRRYFSRGRIYGLDIADKSHHNERRIQTFRGDQNDEKFLRDVVTQIGRPDIIIDDGSHINSHVIKTFEVLFPLLADNGIYVVEDTQTSYWTRYGGTSEDLSGAPTTMCMLKRLVDGLNHQEFERADYTPSYCDSHIIAMHFYHNLVFVQKGLNNEQSGL
jgi:hypothetical protein